MSLERVKDKEYLQNLYLDMQNSYYWSDDWGKEFYIELAKAGFISTTYDTKDGLVLLPEIQYDYAVLDFENLHISKKVKRLIKKESYELSFNNNFNEVVEKLSTQHKYNWLKDEYAKLIKELHIESKQREDFKIISVELISKESNELIAGEVGYLIGKTYTSLSGFSSREKRYANCGTLQLVLLAQYLQESGFAFWNMGHSHMEYKQRLGCITHGRSDFLKRWHKAI